MMKLKEVLAMLADEKQPLDIGSLADFVQSQADEIKQLSTHLSGVSERLGLGKESVKGEVILQTLDSMCELVGEAETMKAQLYEYRLKMRDKIVGRMEVVYPSQNQSVYLESLMSMTDDQLVAELEMLEGKLCEVMDVPPVVPEQVLMEPVRLLRVEDYKF